MNYHAKCEVCTANKYGLWGRKSAVKTWPKRVKAIYKRLRNGESISILKTNCRTDN